MVIYNNALHYLPTQTLFLHIQLFFLHFLLSEQYATIYIDYSWLSAPPFCAFWFVQSVIAVEFAVLTEGNGSTSYQLAWQVCTCKMWDCVPIQGELGMRTWCEWIGQWFHRHDFWRQDYNSLDNCHCKPRVSMARFQLQDDQISLLVGTFLSSPSNFQWLQKLPVYISVCVCEKVTIPFVSMLW